MERFISAALAVTVDPKKVDWLTPNHFRTFNIVKLEWTDWHIVTDDDPRLQTGPPVCDTTSPTMN